MAKINNIYTKKPTHHSLREAFLSNTFLHSVQLREFLTPHAHARLLKEARASKYTKELDYVRHSHSLAKPSPSMDRLLTAPPFLELVKQVTGKSLRPVKTCLLRVGHKDYSLLHDEQERESAYDLIIDLGPQWDTSWGGRIIYTDGQGNYQEIHPASNSLSIIHKTERCMRYLEYINHHASCRRFLLLATFK